MKLVKELILEKAQKEYGQSLLYGEESDDIIVNPNMESEHLPWRYSYNLVSEDARIMEQMEMDAFYEPVYKQVMEERFQNGMCAMFEKIYIATTNFCNGHCGFCPLGNEHSLKPQFLEDNLIDKIIYELDEMGFCGKISLHGVNEPLLDYRIIEICQKFRKKLPDCPLQILTNGSALTVEKTKLLVPLLDRLDIHIYNDDLVVPKHIEEIVKYYMEKEEYSKKVRVYLRRQNEILSQKGYGNCGRKRHTPIISGCIMPFTTLSILASGDISYCDSDYAAKGSMGNISENTLREIWNGERFNNYRRDMIKGRRNTEFCNKCDFF